LRTIVNIQNLKCAGCKNTIIDKLSKIKNISEVEVDRNKHNIAFEYQINNDFEAAKRLLSRIGYPIVGKENKLINKAQSYVSCAIGKIKI